MLAFIQQIKKIDIVQAILPTKAYISSKSGAIGVQHSTTPLHPRQHLFTHTHTNKLMLRRICRTYQNHFQVKKKRRGVQDGAPDQANPLPGRDVRGAVPPALSTVMLSASDVKSNLHYTRRVTPKHVTSGGAHLRGLAPGLHSSEET